MKKWENYLQFALLFVGTYGERIFMKLHTLISYMNPELFSFICLSIIFVILIKLTSKH